MNLVSARNVRTRAQRLTSLAKELLTLAQEIHPEEACAADLDSQNPDVAASEGSTSLENIARQMYHQRRRRREFFDSKLFGEPAWDLLLDLYIAVSQGKRVSVTSACIAADVPSTTALRWIGLLEKEGLVVRENDEADARRVFIRLTPDGHTRMNQFLASGLLRFGNGGQEE
ncbi:winged helix DNA-binding protein [Altericroceibacterium xinjiangense]|uniref:winged helix DNA-binding protein n=1 Tax=Altericroceibacterium xinjiangense TaxID=762261 RepID=UPI000F7F5776|nr:winged helix DNA-binding protein [Altericroceibacterium xinjiangense]